MRYRIVELASTGLWQTNNERWLKQKAEFRSDSESHCVHAFDPNEDENHVQKRITFAPGLRTCGSSTPRVLLRYLSPGLRTCGSSMPGVQLRCLSPGLRYCDSSWPLMNHASPPLISILWQETGFAHWQNQSNFSLSSNGGGGVMQPP